jgi:hypothetical protein
MSDNNMTQSALTMRIESSEDDKLIVSFKAVGTLKHEDYELITPLIEEALAAHDHPRVYLLFDMTEFEGWELRAAWDDFKLGLKFSRNIEKMAFYGNKKWEEIAAKIANWFINGEAKYFEVYDTALTWLKQDS